MYSLLRIQTTLLITVLELKDEKVNQFKENTRKQKLAQKKSEKQAKKKEKEKDKEKDKDNKIKRKSNEKFSTNIPALAEKNMEKINENFIIFQVSSKRVFRISKIVEGLF